jgi:DNA-binding Lrp family transcriptional regulator
MEHYHPKDEMKRYVRAFIYLATKLGKEKSVAEDLWRIPEIKEVHIVPGKYDILAVAEVERSSWSRTRTTSTGSSYHVSRVLRESRILRRLFP